MKFIKIIMLITFSTLFSTSSLAQSCSAKIDEGYEFDVQGMRYLDRGRDFRRNAEEEASKSNPNDQYICGQIESSLNAIRNARVTFQSSRDSYRQAYAVCTGNLEVAARERLNQANKNIDLQEQPIADMKNILANVCGK